MNSSYLPSGRNIPMAIGFLVILFFSATWMLVRANGYIFLWRPFRLVKTGVISLVIEPNSQIQVNLNGAIQPEGKRDFPDLVPGRYTLNINRDGFNVWEKTLDLAAGQAIRFNHITLFYTQPARQIVPETNQKSFEGVLASVDSLKTDLQIIDGEIWNGDHLVARYSEPVSEVMWLPGRTHLLARLGNTIHVMESTGEHDQIMVTLPTGQSLVQFVPISGGAEMVVKVDHEISVYQLTESNNLLAPALQRLRSRIE